MNFAIYYNSFVYIPIIIAGSFVSAILSIKAISIKNSMYRYYLFLITTILLHSTLEFLLSTFFMNDETKWLFRPLISFSDVSYFLMIVAWLSLIDYLSENKLFFGKKRVVAITAVYGVIVELCLHVYWGNFDKLSFFSGIHHSAHTVIIVLNMVFNIIIAICAIIGIIFGLKRMHRNSQKKVLLFFSGTLLIYVIWIGYWDFIVAMKEESVRLRIDPIFFLFLALCIYSLALFFKQKGLLALSYESTSAGEDWQTIQELFKLTRRELEIAKLVFLGKTNPEVAKELYIAEDTVKKHVNHIFQKSGTTNRYKLITCIRDNMNKDK